MSKVNNTRKQKAMDLLNTLAQGPHLGSPLSGEYTPDEAMKECRLWLDTWVLPRVKELVPELRRSSTSDASK